MANDALKRASRKARKAYAEGNLVADVPYTSDDPQSQVTANAQAPVDAAIGNQIKSDYENRLTYEDAVKAAKGDPESQTKVHSKSLGAAMGSLGGETQAARMANAEKMGFDTSKTYYHGTPESFENFKVGNTPSNGDTLGQGVYLADNPELANTYAGRLGNRGGYDIALNKLPEVEQKARDLYPEHSSLSKDDLLDAIKSTKDSNGRYKELINFADEQIKKGSNILPVHTNANNTFDYLSEDAPPKKLVSILLKEPELKESRNALKNVTTNADLSEIMLGHLPSWRVTQILSDLGYDSAKHAEIKVVFDPKNIRSKFAEFNPKKASSPKLSYADGGDVINYDQMQPQSQQPAPQAEQPHSGNVNVLSPENELVSVPPEQLHDAISTGYRLPTSEEETHGLNQQEFGTAGQQAITGLEGAAESATFGLSTAAEVASGLSTPERIRARREENPGSHMLGAGVGLAASALIPVVGEANILRAGGEGLAAAAGLAKASGVVEQIGSQAIKGAFDMALLQGGDEMSKAFAKDPNQTAETAIADIGLATVMGGMFGGAVGAALGALHKPYAPMVSQVDRPGIDAGDFKDTVEKSGLFKPKDQEGILAGLKKDKADAPDIRAAGERLGAPVMEGMTSDSKLVQKAEDALINGVPTYSGIKRQDLYNQGYQRATGAVDSALGEGSNHSKAELGSLIKQGITFNLEEQNKPIQEMYDALKAGHSTIPLESNVGETLVKDLEGLQELRISPSSPEGQLAKRSLSEIQNLKTVDDVRAYKSILQRSVSPTASSGEKRMASILSDKLTQLEENSIESFAKKQGTPELMDLIQARRDAIDAYKPFINKVKTLSEQLGKGRVYGVQDALSFINDRLTPEQITSRLFSKNNSEFLEFFSKEFPDQMGLMRDYQKGALREAASKTGTLSPKMLFNQVNKLEPEVQAALFSKTELQNLEDAETYLRAFPKNFNPSGTSTMTAMRGFFEHPMGAVMANARDFGIEQFIKLAGASPEINQATSLAKAAVRGEKRVKSGINNIFKAADDFVVPPDLHKDHSSDAERSKLDKMVTQYLKNPDKINSIGDNNPIPEFSQAFSASAARAVQYLGAIKPDTAPKAPLDSRMPASTTQKAEYDRALTVASNPLSVLNLIQAKTLTIKDVQTLNAIYPSLYKKLSGDIMNRIQNHVEAEKTIPYSTRMSLSTFLGQPLDSTLTPMGIIGAQPAPPQQPQGPQSGGEQGAGPKKSTSSLSKLPQSYQTSEQSRSVRSQRQK